MKTATKPSTKQAVLTSDDVRRMMEEAAAKGEKRLCLSGRTIESVDLQDCDVPVSLDFNGATILGEFYIAGSKFGGYFIDLDDATVKRSVTLTNLGDKPFSLYLRNACVGVEVALCAVNLNWLCVGGLRIKDRFVRKQVRTHGAVTFNNGISWDPCD